jgi:hypothetical protein
MIRYDVRGHGRSDQPLEATDYESARHAEDWRAVCEAFGVEEKKPFVAGWLVLISLLDTLNPPPSPFFFKPRLCAKVSLLQESRRYHCP